MSIAKRIFLALFVLGLLPFYALLYYMAISSSTQLEKMIEIEQMKKVEAINIMIDQDIDVLNREVNFLANLPLMDDLITGDIDHRIATLIAIKQAVYKLPTTIHVHSDVVAVERNATAQTPHISSPGQGLHFKQQITASFNAQWRIGEIEIILPFTSLEHYFKTRKEQWCALYEQQPVAGDCTFDASLQQLFRSKQPRKALEVMLIANSKAMMQPIALLRRQLLFIALFALVALGGFFLFVSKMISKPIAQNIQLKDQQLQLLARAKEAAESKNRFISQMSHDFRTPLNSIIGFSQFIGDEALITGEFAHVPALIEQSGKELLLLVNQLLDYAKAQSGELRVVRSPVELCALIEPLVEAQRVTAEQKGLTLTVVCEPVTLVSDATLLKRIVMNLLANAIKYTDEGFVQVRITQRSVVEIVVEDSGIGVDEADAALLFEPFMRLKPASHCEGAGLGLALCKAYADKLGASIGYRPAAKGSAFYLHIKAET